jgi:hypothetical protein
MVVMDSCHNIATDARLPECSGECGSEAHSPKIRMDGERNPRRSEYNGQTLVKGNFFGQDNGKSFRLTD